MTCDGVPPPAPFLQSVSEQLYALLRRAPCGIWMERLEQQEDTIHRLGFMEDALDVVIYCSLDLHAGAAARSMVDIGRRLLFGDATGGSDEWSLHAYLELQARVKAFCRWDRPMIARLERMEATVMWAVEGDTGNTG